VVVRLALWPAGPVTVALVVPFARVTLREDVFPFGPVVLELTLPALRVAVLVAVLPFAPVAVVVRVRCADAPAARIKTAASMVKNRDFIEVLLGMTGAGALLWLPANTNPA
jgi:hypothetical protein